MSITKVLIVEDDRAQLIHLQNIVTGAGYRALTASNGDEGVAKARAEKPDVILMDVNMPGSNGFEATRALKADISTKNIPVIIVTVKNQKADKLWASMQGAQGFISKPYTDDEILGQLKRL